MLVVSAYFLTAKPDGAPERDPPFVMSNQHG
jgi:hypothetical protein